MADRPSTVQMAVTSENQDFRGTISREELNHRANSNSPRPLVDGMPKKKGTFKITSVKFDSTADADSMDDLDESHTEMTEDYSSEIADTSRMTDYEQETPSVTEDIPLHNQPVQVQADVKEKSDIHSRFRVVKIETQIPFRRGRWVCHDFLDPQPSAVTIDKSDTKVCDDSGSSSAGSSIHYIHGVDDPAKNPLLAGATGTIHTQIPEGQVAGTQPQDSFQPIHPAPQNSAVNQPSMSNNPQSQVSSVGYVSDAPQGSAHSSMCQTQTVNKSLSHQSINSVTSTDNVPMINTVSSGQPMQGEIKSVPQQKMSGHTQLDSSNAGNVQQSGLYMPHYSSGPGSVQAPNMSIPSVYPQSHIPSVTSGDSLSVAAGKPAANQQGQNSSTYQTYVHLGQQQIPNTGISQSGQSESRSTSDLTKSKPGNMSEGSIVSDSSSAMQKREFTPGSDPLVSALDKDLNVIQNPEALSPALVAAVGDLQSPTEEDKSYIERHSAQALKEMSVPPGGLQAASTPVTKLPAIAEPEVSSVSTESDADFIVAGPSRLKRKIQNTYAGPGPSKIQKDQPLLKEKSQEVSGSKRKLARVDIELSSTELEDFCDPDYDPDDPTFEPQDWIDISIVDTQADTEIEDLLHVGVEECVFEVEEDEEEEVGGEFGVSFGDGVPRLKEVKEEDVTEERYIITKGRLEALLDMFPRKRCSQCGEVLVRRWKTIGCTVDSKWSCENKHVEYRWSSSSMMPNGVFFTNFQAVSAVTLSGNNFTKVKLFAQFLNLKFPSRSSFNRVQTKCVVPVVDRYWYNISQTALEEHRAVQVTVSGDGRMDSPGHTAKYCTYTVMNQANKSILALEVVDKRETVLKSGIMEAEGFKRALKSITDVGVVLSEVVTDAHPQISKIMRTTYPEVRHSYDMWHGAKNLGKRMSKVAAVKGNSALTPWLKDITNHFFHCAETCNGSVLDLKTKWVSVLKHVTGCHSWALGQCDHGPMEERDDKPWLRPTSQVIKDLEKQVMDKRLLRTFPYYVTCQTTSELESFNNHVLMYAPKRNAFSYDVYKCRCQLAAIDYTKHLHRSQLTDKDGKPKWKRTYSKAASNWTVHPVKEVKQYIYIKELLVKVAEQFCAKEQALRWNVIIGEHDPRRISSTIAPVSPKSTASLAESLVARIKKN